MAVTGRSVVLVLKVDYAMHNTAITPPLKGLAVYLVQDGFLTFETAIAAIHEAQKLKMTLPQYLIKSQHLSSQSLLACCKKHFAIPIYELKNHDMDFLADPLIALELIYRHRIIPLKRQNNHIIVGLSDPTNHSGLAAIEFHLGLRIQPVLLAEDELDELINRYFRPARLQAELISTLAKIKPFDTQEKVHETEKNDEPVISFVDSLIQEAIFKRISDIHIEPYAHHCRIRFRRDGLLHEVAHLPQHLTGRVITRLKIMANLNIAERRLPQDGRIQLNTENKIDIRINTCPTLYGEKIVLRLLDVTNLNLEIDTLGLLPSQKELLLTKLSQPQGLILVTGPTGSGKTFTLYSALHYLNQIEKNISSVEDPVEIELKGINQVNVNAKIGLSFSTVLRTFLRQDPDVMMIGEIRDTDAATIAMQAAQTGHLVLSTLHTNSALESLVRLQAMKIPSYHLVNSISLLVGQRLIRKLCEHCKIPDKKFSAQKYFCAVGCDECYQGYQGRTGIFELIPITEKIAEHISTNTTLKPLLNTIKQEGFLTLWEVGLEKVKSGITSYAELIRVVENS